MNILYIGPYKQNDEWGLNSRAFLGLLQTHYGENVVSRPIWFTSEEKMDSGFHLLQCEQNTLKTYDVLIQHGLPDRLNYNGLFKKNIAITKIDSKINNTDWVDHLNLFDKIIVFSEYEKTMLIESGVTQPIMAFDFPPVYFSPNMQDLNINFGQNTIFYTYGSLNEKDGVKKSITAYLSVFNKLDNVLLLIVTNNQKEIEEEIKKQKQILGKYLNNDLYPNIGIIAPINSIVLNYLHEKADHYIHISDDSVPTQDLMKSIIFQHQPIVLDTCSNIFDKDYSLLVSSDISISSLLDRAVKQICTGHNTCRTPNIVSLRNAMLLAHSKKDMEKNNITITKVIDKVFTKPSGYIKHVCD